MPSFQRPSLRELARQSTRVDAAHEMRPTDDPGQNRSPVAICP